MDHPPGMSPPGNFMGPPHPGPMMHPAGFEMIPMSPGMYPQNHWPDGLAMGPPMHETFIDPLRFQQQQQSKAPVMINTDMAARQSNFEAPRYSKWRERRDVITNLDRQTAQSSSKTDSLKSSLQQHDSRNHFRKNNNKDNRQAKNEQSTNKQASPHKEPSSSGGATPKTKQSAAPKTDPTEISDGEIIDDEDSSDESDNQKVFHEKEILDLETDSMFRKTPYGRIPADGQQYYDVKKRRRLHDRDDYPMDYETISDEELDDFMSDKKLVDAGRLDGSADGKSSSEIELLNALGLDWANLVELSKQSRKEASTSGSALRRFSMQNYLPTLGITRELAGPEIYNFVMKICH